MQRRIRNSAKALIIKDGKVLLSKLDDNGDVFFIMPGGGQDVGEVLTDTVKRECMEELGIEVDPKFLVFILEGANGEENHRIDFVFLCNYIRDIKDIEIQGDTHQVGAEWVSIDNIMNEPLYPYKYRNAILKLYKNENFDIYLGNENKGDFD